MRKFLSFIAAGFTGACIALSLGWYMIQSGTVLDPGPRASLVKNLNVAPHTANVPFDFKKAAAEATPSVVHIHAKGNNRRGKDNDRSNRFRYLPDDFLWNPQREGTGSGVIYSSDGYIITNNHVVEFADEIEVTLSDNRIYQAELVGNDATTDLAVLKIKAKDLPYLQIADSDEIAVGEWVLAVGNPFDLNSTVTAGIVSAKGRNIELIEGKYAIESFIQTDASVNPGNSGGALVDVNGHLLGINTAIATRNGAFQGYAFAIPINLVTRIADDIIKFGDYQRAYLGISVVEMDSELADEMNVDFTQGVLIEEVADGGSAQYAGLLPKDIITKVDDRPILAATELQEIIGRARVGDTLNITIIRKGQIKNVPVRLKSK
jgi:Do/DeqQ family serine protease